MQRVAIARAIVNNPEIILADEPTGALDSTTSIQVMEILKEISRDRLVIMVTHNPDLADKYSSRIVRLVDGKIVSDSNPFNSAETAEDEKTEKKEKRKNYKVDMSFGTALGLSMKNLLTKKVRTFLTAFAGSIGIIGIALILSLSSGFQGYINSVEENTLSSYPITIEEQSADMENMMSAAMGSNTSSHENAEQEKKIYSNSIMSQMMNTMISGVTKNDLASFKAYLDSDECKIEDYATDIQYSYGGELNIYRADTDKGIVRVNPSPLLDDMGVESLYEGTMFESTYSTYANVFKQLVGDSDFVKSQYDVVAGRLPSSYNEVCLIVNRYNEVSDYTLYSLGILDQEEFKEIINNLGKSTDGEDKISVSSFSYDQIMNQEFSVVPGSDFYKKSGLVYRDMSSNSDYVKNLIDNGLKIKVVGIIKSGDAAIASQEIGSIGYTSELTDYILEKCNSSDVVNAQRNNKETNILTGTAFSGGYQVEEKGGAYYVNGVKITKENAPKLMKGFVPASQLAMVESYISKMSEEDLQAMIPQYMEQMKEQSASYEGNLKKFGAGDRNAPTSINIYAKDFESKEAITNAISEYNESVSEDKHIQYTDYIGLLLSGVSKIVKTISYILIAFVAISLVVSSIMIGIITYISVLERTREIGILRSIGASKRDVSNVFNAETLIIGFVSGAIGIIVTVLLDQPINWLIAHYTAIEGVAALPWYAALILIAVSVFLTFISGLIPASIAAKKDPVVALRTE